jgi:hypothetical protein
MKLYPFIATAFFLSSIVPNAKAQEQDLILPATALEVVNMLNETGGSEYINYSFTEQKGNDNLIEIFTAELSQLNKNIVAVGQFGNANLGVVSQNGNNLKTGICQNGNQNTANINSLGNNIYSLVTQVGNNNLVEQDIENNNQETSKNVSTEQLGDDNVIKLVTSTFDYSSIEVVQNGSNNMVDLDFTNAGSQSEPYSVTQTGNDAAVIINQSYFYMPMQSFSK